MEDGREQGPAAVRVSEDDRDLVRTRSRGDQPGDLRADRLRLAALPRRAKEDERGVRGMAVRVLGAEAALQMEEKGGGGVGRIRLGLPDRVDADLTQALE